MASAGSAAAEPVTGRDWCALAAVLTSGVALVLWVLRACRYGVDFSDEGFYLNWISRPWIYAFSVSQFGFIYHPVYRLVGGDITALRQANVLITLALSWILFRLALGKVAFDDGTVRGDGERYVSVVAFVYATSSLLVLLYGTTWLPTPSYNSLALQGILIAASGIVLAESVSSRASVVGWTLIGVGGWLTFMAKPTSALALAAAVGVYLTFAGRMKLRLVILSLAAGIALIAASAWTIDGSVRAFALRLIGGADEAALLGGGHTLAGALRWDSVSFTSREQYAFVAIAVLTGVCTYLGIGETRVRRHLPAVVAVLTAFCAGGIVAGWYAPAFAMTQRLELLVAAGPIGGVAATIVVLARRGLKARPVGLVPAACLAAVLPHVYAVGSNSNYWVAGSSAAVLWILAGIFLMGALRGSAGFWPTLTAMGAVTQCIVTLLLQIGMENPYRQTLPLSEYRDPMKSVGSGDVLVSPSAAAYIRRLRELSSAAGFREETPMIDLTGRSPGALYAIGAEPVGLAWMLGGYPGSDEVARRALDRVPCKDIGRAWILMEPTGQRHLSEDLLRRYGADVVRDFVIVGSLDSPTGEFQAVYEQILLKPIRDSAVAELSCSNRRSEKTLRRP